MIRRDEGEKPGSGMYSFYNGTSRGGPHMGGKVGSYLDPCFATAEDRKERLSPISFSLPLIN